MNEWGQVSDDWLDTRVRIDLSVRELLHVAAAVYAAVGAEFIRSPLSTSNTASVYISIHRLLTDQIEKLRATAN